MDMKYVYILKSLHQPEKLYIGFTADLHQRIAYHNSGRCAHTSKFMPWQIVYTENFDTERDALKRERQIKGWSRDKKEALIAGDFKALKRLAKRKFGR